MSQTSDPIAQDSTIVILRSDLQNRHYENHQKYRHAFARGLLIVDGLLGFGLNLGPAIFLI
jgi:hypothetical protein